MATRCGVGRSDRRDPLEAGREAADLACRALDGKLPDLLLAFATTGYDQPQVLKGIRAAAPLAALSGCSGEGIIAGPTSNESEHCVGVLAMWSDAISFETLLVTDYSADSTAAGERLAEQVLAASRGDEFALLVFPDGLKGDCTQLLNALDARLPRTITVTGGAAGDALTFIDTFQYRGDVAARDAVSAVLMRGAGRLELAVSHGCVPIGLERHVTRAQDSWMQEIDGQPAWSVFRQYLEGEPEDLNTEGAIHLSVGEPFPEHEHAEYEPFIIRTPMGLDRESGALYFPGGGLASGGAIRLTRRDPERVRQSAREAAERIARRNAGREPAAVLQFDCAGRGRQLFGSSTADSIVVPLQQAMGRDLPWLGFHTYGEIAPIGGRTRYHNFTVSLCALHDTSTAP